MRGPVRQVGRQGLAADAVVGRLCHLLYPTKGCSKGGIAILAGLNAHGACVYVKAGKGMRSNTQSMQMHPLRSDQ